MNLPWTHAGMPVLGLPAGESSDSGMPLGIQFIAPMGRDEELLAWGAVLERDLAVGLKQSIRAAAGPGGRVRLQGCESGE